jgi:hypothetical protein
MALLVAPLSQAFATNTCEELFEKNLSHKITRIQSSQPINSRIQTAEWIKKVLIKDGGLEKLKKSDLKKDHNELFSDMLQETVKLLLQDFFQKNSKLKDVVGAEIFLKTIVDDISAHRGNHTVTYEYFFKINYAISKLISLKHQQHLAKSYQGREFQLWRDMLENATEKELPLYAYKIPEYFQELMNDKTYQSKLDKLSHEGIYFLPTFADLTMQDIIDLGIEIAPLGMTLNENSHYDGLMNVNAFEYFNHDISHAEILGSIWSLLSLDEKTKFLKIQKFLSSENLQLDPDQKIVLSTVLFEKIHELPVLGAVVLDFYQPPKAPSSFVEQNLIKKTFSKLNDPLYNRQFSLSMGREEYLETFKAAQTKAINQFQKENNISF